MRVFSQFSTQHRDLVHDVSYNFYGTRIATCSSDQIIKIWDKESSGGWKNTASFKAHEGSIWKVTWAHPEFGNVLATCSFDRTVRIWEEEVDAQGKSTWSLRATLVDSRDSVVDIKFAPRHLGLKIASCSADGFVRIYEASDVVNLEYWTLMEEFEAQKGGVECIAWNPSPFEPQSLVVGSAKNEEPVARIWQYSEASHRWQPLVALEGHSGAVHDVNWAPNLGRSFHLLATASKDNTVRVWQVGLLSKGKPEVSCLATFDDHKSEVWRVEWNITGTLLASSGDDNTVRLWKANFNNQWKCLSVLRGGEDDEHTTTAAAAAASATRG